MSQIIKKKKSNNDLIEKIFKVKKEKLLYNNEFYTNIFFTLLDKNNKNIFLNLLIKNNNVIISIFLKELSKNIKDPVFLSILYKINENKEKKNINNFIKEFFFIKNILNIINKINPISINIEPNYLEKNKKIEKTVVFILKEISNNFNLKKEGFLIDKKIGIHKIKQTLIKTTIEIYQKKIFKQTIANKNSFLSLILINLYKVEIIALKDKKKILKILFELKKNKIRKIFLYNCINKKEEKKIKIEFNIKKINSENILNFLIKEKIIIDIQTLACNKFIIGKKDEIVEIKKNKQTIFIKIIKYLYKNKIIKYKINRFQ